MSSINPNNINGEYPVAGQDNNSQGFRDNFTNIKRNFTFAYNEINDLQQKAILKTALSGGTVNNDMTYTQLIHAQFLASAETVNQIGTADPSITINWEEGHFQTMSITGNTSVSFSNWPASSVGVYGKIRLQITPDNVDYYITFNGADVNNVPNAINSTTVKLPLASVPYLYEISSIDNTTFSIIDLLQGSKNVNFGEVNVTSWANVKGTSTSTSTTTGALVVAGGAGVGGNVSYGALLIAPNTSYITVSSSTTYSLSSTVSDNVLGVTTTGLTATLNMPSNPVEGQICEFAANAAVTLALGTGTVSPTFAGSVSAGAAFKYVYKASTTGSFTGATWYRVG